MKILIVGGSGFCGSNFSKYYLDRGHSVTIFDNLSGIYSKHNLEWLNKQYNNLDIIVGDLKNFDILKKIIVNKDIVFHLAGQVSATKSIRDPREDFETNLLGTFNLLESIRIYNSSAVLMYISTNKVYGELKNFDLNKYPYGVDENFPLDFYTPYSCSKGGADQYVHDYNRIYDLKTIVFRLSSIYGRRQFGIESQGWISWFIYSYLIKKSITIYGNGRQVRDILYIDDLIDACNSVIFLEEAYGEIYNIGGGYKNCLSLNKLLYILEDITGEKIIINYEKARFGDQNIYVSDIRKIETVCDWKPLITVHEGLNIVLEWINNNEKLWNY